MKTANPRSHSPDPKLFFSGLMVHVADLPENDKNAIIGGVEAMGGIYASAISKQVTHIVALSEASDACQVAITRKLNIKIVLPHWYVRNYDNDTHAYCNRFDDCLRLGHRISEEPYQLPNPEILEPSNGDTPPPKYDIRLIGISTQVDTNVLPLSGLPKIRDVFKSHKIKLSSDLGISEHLLRTISSVIEAGEGEVVHSVDMADTLVCQYRDSEDFREAGQSGITIGNLAWLYHIVLTNSWTSPLQRLLHFPIARAGLPGFKAYRLSLSNYNGDARLYLENLAKAAGCEFTKSMKADNTHLITAHTKSEKCDAAKEWNIHIVNHLWLEESYAKWCVQSVANSRYTHFPARTNLGEVVGQTAIDKTVLEKNFFPAPEKPTAKTAPKTGTKPSDLTERLTKPDKAELDANRSGILKSSPALSHRQKDVNATPTTGKRNRRSELAEGPATPAPISFGKENETPSTGARSSRSAKVKAVANMSNYSEDFALLAKQKKQKGGIIHGGRSSEELVQSPGLKRSLSVEIVSGPDEPKSKKSKKEYPLSKMKLLVTGHVEWSEDQSIREREEVSFACLILIMIADAMKEQLAQLGIELTENPAECSFVAAPKIMRTKKFICAMAGAPTLLSLEFVRQCLKQNKLLRPADYPLIDKAGEKTYHIKITDAVKRAKANKGRLLKGQTIYITQDVKGGPDTYRDIIETNGGNCVVFKGRTNSLSAAIQDTETSELDSYVYLLSGESKAEEVLWPKFREQAEVIRRKARVVKTDWMLDLALSQHIRWDRTYEIEGQ